MLQQKKLHANNPKYYLDCKEGRPTGKKVARAKQIKSKIFKNLSEFPIQLLPDSKENHSVGQANRPHSSLVNYDAPTVKPPRFDSALSHYPEGNRKRLSLDSTSKKYERQSLVSRNSISKKMSRNNKSIEEGLKARTDDRRKNNQSCSSATEEVNRESKAKKKNSIKNKRPSINNLHAATRQPREGKENAREYKDIGSVFVKDPREHRPQKDKSKSKNKRKKSTLVLDKSKASTAVIGFPQEKSLFKKKQSTSTTAINPNPKKIKEKDPRKKPPKKKSQKIEGQGQEQSVEEYPINKYDVDVTTKKTRMMGRQSRSKSRKGSSSKQPHKRAESMLQIDYNSCINMPSNSSGLINSSQSASSHRNANIKIMDNWQFRSLAEDNPHPSLDLDEIRYYQSYHDSKKKNQKQFIDRKFKNQSRYRKRKQIEAEILDDYPHFTQLELKFLASVVFIQRKWRQYKLYKQIFNNLALSPFRQKDSTYLQKSHSNILNISQQKSTQKEKEVNKEKDNVKEERLSPAPLTPFDTLNYRDSSSKSKEVKREEQWPKLGNNPYLEARGDNSHRDSEFGFFSDSNVEQPQSGRSSAFSARSQRYQFLQNQIFPSMTYLVIRKQQLKKELLERVQELKQLQKSGMQCQDFKKLKDRCEEEYGLAVKALGKSQQDIKKGYLKFIDTYKFIRHEALRKVSSETGLMASMYHRVFQLDQPIATPSNSSDSLRTLRRKLLIRKEFFLTQKMDPMFPDHLLLSERTPVQGEQRQLSARCFRGKKERMNELKLEGFKKREIFLDIEDEEDRMDLKRIKEGFIASPRTSPHPSPQHNPPCEKPTPSISKLQAPQLFTPSLSHQRQQELLLEQVIATLTHQLFVELIRIDERRENVIDIINEEFERDRRKIFMVKESEVGHQEDLEVVEEEKLREIYKIQGLQEGSGEGQPSRRHRNSHTFNISPASSEKVSFELEDILLYAQQLFSFLTNPAYNLLPDLLRKLNKNQGFTPLEYLKFLRDFQIPDQQYEPLISNQTFVQWQDYFYTQQYPIPSEEAHLQRQTITIFHRCIFESIICLLEEHRPCGEKGVPFPWEKTVYFLREVAAGDLEKVFLRCQERLKDTLRLNCGIIDEKYIVCSEEDLERIHEENEDRIINMLERELEAHPHNWYEVEEHCLEIKLQVEHEVFDYLMLEALDEFLENS